MFFYCGSGFEGEYQGVVIYKKELKGELDEATKYRFEEALKRIGLSKELIPRVKDLLPVDYNNCKPIKKTGK